MVCFLPTTLTFGTLACNLSQNGEREAPPETSLTFPKIHLQIRWDESAVEAPYLFRGVKDTNMVNFFLGDLFGVS